MRPGANGERLKLPFSSLLEKAVSVIRSPFFLGFSFFLSNFTPVDLDSDSGSSRLRCRHVPEVGMSLIVVNSFRE